MQGTDVATWLEAIAVVASVGLSGYIAWWQMQGREADVRELVAHDAHLVSGWAEAPERPPARRPATGWRVAATVWNRAPQAIWDVHASVLVDGEAVGLPVLRRSVLPPEERWTPEWVVGQHAVPHFASGTEMSAMPLPFPKALSDPSAVVSLEISFTDARGNRWTRRGSDLRPCEGEAEMTESAREYSRALELADSKAAPRRTQEIGGALLESAALAARERMAAVANGRHLVVSDVAGLLAFSAARFRISPHFVTAGDSTSAAVLAGAYVTINDDELYVSLFNEGDVAALKDLSEQVCGLLAAWSGAAFDAAVSTDRTPDALHR